MLSSSDFGGARRDDVVERLSRPSGLIEGVCSIAGKPVVLDSWQRHFVDTRDNFNIWNKARQIGWSFAAACRAWSRCYLKKAQSYLAVFVSYNLEDAKEKIRYVKALDNSLPRNHRLPREVWSKTEIEFANGNRIVTMFMPRGKGPAELFLDEHAHMQDARTIFHAGIPMVSRGGGVFDGSSPQAKFGMFYDIYSGAEGKFKNFKRMSVPWWRSSALCIDIKGACRGYTARDMSTPDRVDRFGTERLKLIYNNMFEELFKTEYECQWSDETMAFLSLKLIKACSPFDPDRCIGVRQVAGLRELAELRGNLYVGMDVGRRRDLTEIHVGEVMSTGRVEGRMWISIPSPAYPSRTFAAQERICRDILDLKNTKRFVIDRNAIGEMLAERLKGDYPAKVIDQVLSMKSKPQIAENMRAVMEKGGYQFYANRDVRDQFHSIRRRVTAHGNVTYDADRNEKHHADKFWAAALMLWGASDTIRGERPHITVIRKPAGGDI